jgi:hypothetical protein
MRLAPLLILVLLNSAFAAALMLTIDRMRGSAAQGLFAFALGVVAMMLAIFFAWPVARLFRVSPLMFLSGPCPGCGRRPSGWWSDQTDRHLLKLACGQCGQRVDVWLTKAPPTKPSPDVPTYVLRGPRLLGIWRRIPSAPPS